MRASIGSQKLERHWFAIGGLCLLPFFLLYLFVSDGAQQTEASNIPIRMTSAADQPQQPSHLSRDGGALLLEAEGGTAQAELHFSLPRREAESPHWVVWMRRVPLQRMQLHAGENWHSDEYSFLAPTRSDGLLPVGYLIRLPSAWEGDITLRLQASPLRNASLRPQVVSESEAVMYMQRATTITVAAYASLLTLVLLALALYFASRDMTFLSFFGFSVVCMFQIAAYNGHLFALDHLGLFARMGSGGLTAMSLVFEAAALRFLLRYTELSKTRAVWARRINLGAIVLLLLAAGSIVWGISGGRAWSAPLLLAWLLGAATAFWMLFDAWKRRVVMSSAVLCSVLGIVVAVVLSELSAAGVIVGSLATHYGYQIATVITALMLAVGLISRISRYREQRDREQRAREESERKLYREAVRSELLTALQMGLRGLDEDELQTAACRLLLEHLHRVVPVGMALAMTRGYLGRDTLVSWPTAALERMSEHDLHRLQTLRQQLSGSVELQYPIAKSGEEMPVAMEAAVSMPIRAPAWGALVLERAGATPFHPQELAIARELARIAVTQIEEAVAALKLRHTAEIDALTGSMNRRSIDQMLNRAFQQSHRTGAPLSVLFVDIDHFKSINDTLGHACGDYCLRELARALKAPLGVDDVLGRYGGEEFVVVLPDRATEMARAIAEELRLSVEASEFVWNDRALRLTVSIGIASRLDGESSPQAALERADRALYAAKRAGRNRVQVAPAVFKARPTPAN